MKRILLALFALSLIAGAADLTTKSGNVYKNYDVDRATPYGVAIFHDGGSATVPYADLPDELRKKYSEEEKQADEKLRKMQETRELAIKIAKMKKAERRIALKVISQIADGYYGEVVTGKVAYRFSANEVDKLLNLASPSQKEYYRKTLSELCDNFRKLMQAARFQEREFLGMQQSARTTDVAFDSLQKKIVADARDGQKIVIKSIKELHTTGEVIILSAWPEGTTKVNGMTVPVFTAQLPSN